MVSDIVTQLDLEDLLSQWEKNYKKGLLTFWIMLLLSENELYAYEMPEAIVAISQGTIAAEDNSIYRALRRFTDAGLVQSEKKPSDMGPPRRYYSLTLAGRRLLAAFIERNIYVFQAHDVAEAMQRALDSVR